MPRSLRSRRPRWPMSPPGRVTKARPVTAVTAPTVARSPGARDEGSPSHCGHGQPDDHGGHGASDADPMMIPTITAVTAVTRGRARRASDTP
jgi:hypothetical protein